MKPEERKLRDIKARIADTEEGKKQSLALIARHREALRRELASLDAKEAAVVKQHDELLVKWKAELGAL